MLVILYVNLSFIIYRALILYRKRFKTRFIPNLCFFLQADISITFASLLTAYHANIVSKNAKTEKMDCWQRKGISVHLT